MIIAVDGPAASGKGTLAKRLAAHFGLNHLDTGLLYRAVARDVAKLGLALDDREAAATAARRLDHDTLGDPGLRDRKVGEWASIVAAIAEVRAAVLEFQRAFARRGLGAVLDGRDIGTVVCPDADAKLFVTATPEIRAERRHRELIAAGDQIGLAQVLEDINARDERDRKRAASPLAAAADAILLDTSRLDIDAAFEAAVGLIERKISQRGAAHG